MMVSSVTPRVLSKSTCLFTPAALLLAFFLLAFSSPTQAQIVCDNDGIDVEFDEDNGVVELRRVRVRQITGRRRANRSIDVGSASTQSVNYSSGALTVNSLDASAFPDQGIGARTIRRRERNVWTANFPRGMYEFANRNDLVLEIEVSIAGEQASHIVIGPASHASLSVNSSGIDARFYGGNPRSLRQLRGDLTFFYSDLLQLSAAGTHRAAVSLCVNVRGNL